MSNLAVVRDQFTRQAVPFSKAPPIRDEAAIGLIVRASKAGAGMKTLDVACGPGLVAAAFAKVVAEAHGIDATPAMIQRARRIAEHEGVDVVWRVGDAARLPYSDAAFDIVTCRFAFHHFDDPLAALIEMKRVCRPGGRIVVCDGFAPDDPGKAAAFQAMEKLRDPSTTRYLTLAEHLRLFQRADLPAPTPTFCRLAADLDGLMDISFPEPGTEAQVRRLFEDAVEDDRLDMNVRREGDRIVFAYRTVILVSELARC